VYDVFPLQNIMFPYDFCEIPAILNTANESLVQGINQHFKECLSSLTGCEVYDFHKILQGEKERPNIIDVVSFKKQHFDLLNQLISYHVLQDPLAS